MQLLRMTLPKDALPMVEVCVCVYISIYIYTHASTYIHTCVCVCVCVCVCINIYIYIYIYIYTCAHGSVCVQAGGCLYLHHDIGEHIQGYLYLNYIFSVFHCISFLSISHKDCYFFLLLIIISIVF